MQRFTETTHRSIAWLKKANDDGRLEMKPPYQRNPVWSEKQQGSLVETILLEYPVPEIYMQDIVSEAGEEVHVVVDGQQRIRAVLEYISGGFEISEEDSRWRGMEFEDLSPEDKKKIYEYKFVTRILPSLADEQIRAIFQRINRNTVTLNTQELRHATYWGEFIKLMEEIADLEYWGSFGVFSANDRRRMMDAEFVSELTVAYLNGLQNKKIKLEDYYQLYEKEFDDRERTRNVFLKVLGELDQTIQVTKTRWRKKSDFYSLFLVLAKYKDILPLAGEKRDELSDLLKEISQRVDSIIRNGSQDEDEDLIRYVQNVERAASDLGSRKNREEVLLDQIARVLGDPPLL